MQQRSVTHELARLLAFLCLISAAPVMAQVESRVTIPLKINAHYEQPMGFEIKFGSISESANSVPAKTGFALGEAPGAVVIRIERIKDQPFSYRLQVDSDRDGDLTREVSQVLTPNSSVIVKVNRRWEGGRQQSLPYQVKYTRDPDQRNQVQDVFWWSPHYRAEGKLRIKNCEAFFAVLDINGDGLFDKSDFSRGTSIQLDRSGEGQIWGEDEWLKGEQIIEYCGDAFITEAIKADGSSLTLARTNLRVPKIGERLPAFSLLTSGGKTIRSVELRGKVHLLDFWASWCKPCIEKFSLVKQLEEEFKGDLVIIAINVDEASRLPMARQVVKDYRLPWAQIMTGTGESDPLWKMFGGMEGNRLSIPLYVMVDDTGLLRYAGSGGPDLSELRSRIKECWQKITAGRSGIKPSKALPSN
jgi:thiol-disulfide isomerase/thioredoxin